MKVAIDISPTTSGHRVRGIGSYTQHLMGALAKQDWGIKFQFFDSFKASPPRDCDIIHYPFFDLFFRSLPLRKTTRRLVTIHDVIPLVFPQFFPSGIRGYANLYFQKIALKNTDFVICDSETSRKDIIDKLAYPADKIKVIYLAAGKNFRPISDKKLLSVVARKYNLPAHFALYVGDVNWNKNLQGLIEAIKISGINLVMVGSAVCDDSLVQTVALNKLIKKFKIGQQITKTGYVEEKDLVGIYNLADLTILPSFYEGFGLPVLESMACGTPVVCSNVASLSEIASQLAIFCDPTSPQDIAKKINHVLEFSKHQKERLSQKLLRHASKFSWKRAAAETVQVYRMLSK